MDYVRLSSVHQGQNIEAASSLEVDTRCRRLRGRETRLLVI